MKRYRILDKVTLDFEGYNLILTPAYHDLFIESDGKTLSLVTCYDGGHHCGERRVSTTSVETLKRWERDGQAVKVEIFSSRGTPTNESFFLGFACGCSFAMLLSTVAELFR